MSGIKEYLRSFVNGINAFNGAYSHFKKLGNDGAAEYCAHELKFYVEDHSDFMRSYLSLINQAALKSDNSDAKKLMWEMQGAIKKHVDEVDKSLDEYVKKLINGECVNQKHKN